MWDRLRRRLERYAIPDLARVLVAGQALFYIASWLGIPAERFAFVPSLALGGEWWRFLTFLFIPPLSNPLFAIFAWYLFYLMGSALEAHWGALRFDLFIFTGYLLNVGAALLSPWRAATNAFLGGSVFLAFAFLYPDFELLILFLLPVKVKWLALLTWLGYLLAVVAGSWQTRLGALAAIGNFLLFFGPELLRRLRRGHRDLSSLAKQAARGQQAFHRCAVCGVTELSHPTMDFRYCPQCGLGYCRDHLAAHAHVKEKP